MMRLLKSAVACIIVVILTAFCGMTVFAYDSTDLASLKKYLLVCSVSPENFAGQYNLHEDYDEAGNPVIDILDLVAMKKRIVWGDSEGSSGGYNPSENETPFIPKH